MYPSDLKDKEWEKIKVYFEHTNGWGHRSKYDRRVMVNAILYVVKTGCQWRQLPVNFPPWKTVYTYFRRLCLKGRWEKVLDTLVSAKRSQIGRGLPSYSIIDSQSVKTTGACEERGLDGGKKNQRTKKAPCR